MRAWGIGNKAVLLGAGWVFSLLLTSQMAIASPPATQRSAKNIQSASEPGARDKKSKSATKSADAGANRVPEYSGSVAFPRGKMSRQAHAERGNARLAANSLYRGYRGPTLQCVAYARSASNISLSGNAADWWDNAAGLYARGNRPQAGGVLAFTANGRMRLGHVAVVSRVVNGREIEIDHANWGGYRGAIARAVPVVDVSANNDWTAVRVGLASSGDFGSVYPTFGFIYDRPDNGVRVASVSRPAPVLALNPAPADLRPGYGRQTFTVQSYSFDEVAEAPADRRAFERPDRSLR